MNVPHYPAICRLNSATRTTGSVISAMMKNNEAGTRLYLETVRGDGGVTRRCMYPKKICSVKMLHLTNVGITVRCPAAIFSHETSLTSTRDVSSKFTPKKNLVRPGTKARDEYPGLLVSCPSLVAGKGWYVVFGPSPQWRIAE
jgi:hypothetical protein